MTSKFAETALTNLLPVRGGKMELSEIFDKDGRPQKVWVNPQDPSMPPIPVGSAKTPEMDVHEKDIKYLMSKEGGGYSREQAITLAYGTQTTLPTAPGGNVMTVNRLETVGAPAGANAAPQGGMLPALATLPPGVGGAGGGMLPAPGMPAPQPQVSTANTVSGNAKPIAVTPGGPYAPSTIVGPGVKTIVSGGNRVGQEKLMEDAKKYTDELQKIQLPEYEKALARAESTVAKYPAGKLPGVGVGKSSVPDAILTEEGRIVRTALEPLRRIEALAAGGKNLTKTEMEQIQKLLGTGFFSTEAQARQAIQQLREKVNAIKSNLKAGVHPDVLRYVDQQQGGGSRPPLESFVE